MPACQQTLRSGQRLPNWSLQSRACGCCTQRNESPLATAGCAALWPPAWQQRCCGSWEPRSKECPAVPVCGKREAGKPCGVATTNHAHRPGASSGREARHRHNGCLVCHLILRDPMERLLDTATQAMVHTQERQMVLICCSVSGSSRWGAATRLVV